MKRFVFLMIWASLLISCSDDEKPSNNFIEGTRWKLTKFGSKYTDSGDLTYSYQENYRLDFTNTAFILTKNTKYDRNLDGIYEEEEEPRIVNGTYTFEYPVTTLRPDEGKVIKIKIGTYQIEMVPEGSGESSLVFTKIRE
ncbi:MAG: hypothetical protein LBU37_00595 [Tannerellaceae bacterium]|jgi:hypothetical protein|nr:hypothetical protein [Tannerellaceae bacterium]